MSELPCISHVSYHFRPSVTAIYHVSLSMYRFPSIWLCCCGCFFALALITCLRTNRHKFIFCLCFLSHLLLLRFATNVFSLSALGKKKHAHFLCVCVDMTERRFANNFNQTRENSFMSSTYHPLLRLLSLSNK